MLASNGVPSEVIIFKMCDAPLSKPVPRPLTVTASPTGKVCGRLVVVTGEPSIYIVVRLSAFVPVF